MTAELMVYALIAAGLIFWLRSILGTRDEDEGDNTPLNLEIDDSGKIVGFGGGGESKESNGLALIEELAQDAKNNMAIEDETAKNGLIEIVKEDRNFDIYVFLQAAQDAFVYVVESYAEGDRETLRDLLSPQVYEAFEGAITQREKDSETMQTEILSVKKSEVVEAKIDNKLALVTVRFWADETTVTRDEEGEIVSGHPDKVTQMRDVWTFSRELRSRDPRWLVVETREDGIHDNDTIPNTH